MNTVRKPVFTKYSLWHYSLHQVDIKEIVIKEKK